jgi:hypothetical protein
MQDLSEYRRATAPQAILFNFRLTLINKCGATNTKELNSTLINI